MHLLAPYALVAKLRASGTHEQICKCSIEGDQSKRERAATMLTLEGRTKNADVVVSSSGRQRSRKHLPVATGAGFRQVAGTSPLPAAEHTLKSGAGVRQNYKNRLDWAGCLDTVVSSELYLYLFFQNSFFEKKLVLLLEMSYESVLFVKVSRKGPFFTHAHAHTQTAALLCGTFSTHKTRRGSDSGPCPESHSKERPGGSSEQKPQQISRQRNLEALHRRRLPLGRACS